MKKHIQISFKTLFVSLFVYISFVNILQAQTVIINHNFNGITAYPVSASSTATNVTGTLTSSETTYTSYAGIASGSQAFANNSTASDAVAMSNSNGTNTRYWIVTLGGSDLQNYKSYRIYLQARRSPYGAQKITVSYSTDGSTYTSFNYVSIPTADSFTEGIIDLTNATNIDLQNTVYFKLAVSESSSANTVPGTGNGTGTFRIDNLQIQAIKVINGSNTSMSVDTMYVHQRLKVGNSIILDQSGNNLYTDNAPLFLQSKASYNFNTIINANNTGKLGIGLINPLVNVHIKGITDYSQNPPPENSAILRIQDSSINNQNSQLNRNSWWDFISSAANSKLLFSTGTGSTTKDVMVLRENGNVGIGTTTPDYNLEIAHHDATGSIVLNNTTTTSFTSKFIFKNISTEKWLFGIDPDANKTNSFFIAGGTNTNTKFLIDQNGNVGFGATTLSQKFEINHNTGAGTANGINLRNLSTENKNSEIKFFQNTTALWAIGNDISHNNGHNFFIYDEVANSPYGATRFFIDEKGRTGIGTGTPTQQLTVQHNDTTGGILISQGDAYSPIMPSEIKFSHKGIHKWSIGSHFSPSSTYPPSFFIWNNNVSKLSLFISDSNKVAIGNNDQPIANLDVTGNLRVSDLSTHGVKLLQVDNNGILSTTTVNPSSLTNITNLSFWNSSATDNIYTTYAKVGIGTDTPQVNLHLKGITNGGTNPLSTYFRIEDEVHYTPSGSRNVYWDLIVSGVHEKFVFRKTAGNSVKEVMTLREDGKVFIGLDTCVSCESANYDLFVKRGIVTKDVKVTSQMWSDYVFAKDYRLMQLSELEKYISENNHLPNIPSAKEVISNGFELGNMQQKLLEKVEEQTLYIINLQKQIDELRQLLNQNK